MKMNITPTKSPLSMEFKIACEIYHYELKHAKCGIAKIRGNFITYGFDKKRTDAAVDTLHDWSIISCKYDEPTKQTLYIIADDAKPHIKVMYNKWWKEERSNLKSLSP